MKIHIGTDHAGYELKEKLKAHLESKGTEMNDHGTYTAESVDYPDYAHAVADAVMDTMTPGILICGSANGVAMAANKHQGIRAAICWTEEIAQLARTHNDANIICIPARYVSEDLAMKMVDVFLATPFEGGRHQRRVSKIACN
jgi:ribose 5-phosphate isomerase B